MPRQPVFHAARRRRGKWHRFEDGQNGLAPYPDCGGAAYWTDMLSILYDVTEWPPPGIRPEDCCRICSQSAAAATDPPAPPPIRGVLGLPPSKKRG